MTNLSAIWQEFLSMVQDEAGSRVVETWLKAITFTKWDGLSNIAYLCAPNKFVLDWINKNYLELIQSHLSRLLNVPQLKIQLEVPAESARETSGVQSSNIAVVLNQEKNFSHSSFVSTNSNFTSPHLGLAKIQLLRDDQFVPNPAYLFSTFVVGSSNALSHAAAMAVAEKPGLIYNPLFIYGASGLGKTHLLHAIANKIINESEKTKILYQTADRFVNEFIQAIRFDKVHLFRERYKDVDVFLVDDVQFMCNKEQTQEAFFHIFNTFYDQQKQIVFTCDQYPRDMCGISDRLRSRMEWGLITDLQIPPLETRIAILKKKADFHKIVLTDDLANHIAQNVSSSVRELEGTLIRIIAFSTLTHQSISLSLVDRILIRSNKANKAKDPDISDILEPFLNKNGITIEELRSKDRNKDIVRLRHIAMYLAKRYSKKSLSEIANYFSRKDHTTVIHAIDKVELELDEDNYLKDLVLQAISSLKVLD
jgi:chromosomal replication initiator protein